MKSCETLIHESVGKLTPQQWEKFKQWRESAGKPTAEVQCHYLEDLLKTNISRESTPITKHNGRADNGGQEFREGGFDGYVENDEQSSPIVEEAYSLCETYQKHHHLSEADARKVVGLPSHKRSELPEMEDAEWRLFESLCVAGRAEQDAYGFVTGKTLPK
jgi:hypothetical protein